MRFMTRVVAGLLLSIFVFGKLAVFAETMHDPISDPQELQYAIQKYFAPDISDNRLIKSLEYSEKVLTRDVEQAYRHCVQTKLLPENMVLNVYFIWKKEREQSVGRLYGRYIPEVKGICVNLTQYEMMSVLQRKQALTVLLAREGAALLATAEGKNALEKSQQAFLNAYLATRQMYGKQAIETKKARLLKRAFATLIQERETVCQMLGISVQQFKYLDYRDMAIKDTAVSMILFNRIHTKQMVHIAYQASGNLVLLEKEKQRKPESNHSTSQSSQQLKGNVLDAAQGLFEVNRIAQEMTQQPPSKGVAQKREKPSPTKLPAVKRLQVKGADAAGLQVQVGFLDETTRIIDILDSEKMLMEQYALVDGKVTPLDIKTGQPLDTPRIAKLDFTDAGSNLQLEVAGGLDLVIQFNAQEHLVSVQGTSNVTNRRQRDMAAQPLEKKNQQLQFEGKKIQSIELPEKR